MNLPTITVSEAGSEESGYMNYYEKDIFSDLLKGSESNQIEERLKAKFSWLGKYQEKIPLLATMIQLTRTLEKQLKVSGLNQESLTALFKSG